MHCAGFSWLARQVFFTSLLLAMVWSQAHAQTATSADVVLRWLPPTHPCNVWSPGGWTPDSEPRCRAAVKELASDTAADVEQRRAFLEYGLAMIAGLGGRAQEAEQTLRRVRATVERNAPEESLLLAALDRDIAYAVIAQDRASEMVDLNERSRRLFVAALGPNDFHVAKAQFSTAMAWAFQGDDERARRELTSLAQMPWIRSRSDGFTAGGFDPGYSDDRVAEYIATVMRERLGLSDASKRFIRDWRERNGAPPPIAAPADASLPGWNETIKRVHDSDALQTALERDDRPYEACEESGKLLAALASLDALDEAEYSRAVWQRADCLERLADFDAARALLENQIHRSSGLATGNERRLWLDASQRLAAVLRDMGRFREARLIRERRAAVAATDDHVLVPGPSALALLLAQEGEAGYLYWTWLRMPRDPSDAQAMQTFHEMMSRLRGTSTGSAQQRKANDELLDSMERLGSAADRLQLGAVPVAEALAWIDEFTTAMEQAEGLRSVKDEALLRAAQLRADLGELDDAERTIRAVVPRMDARYRGRHPTLADALASLARVRAAGGDYVQAEQYLRKSCESLAGIFGDHHGRSLQCWLEYAATLQEGGATTVAFEQRAEALRLSAQLDSEDPDRALWQVMTLVAAKCRSGDDRVQLSACDQGTLRNLQRELEAGLHKLIAAGGAERMPVADQRLMLARVLDARQEFASARVHYRASMDTLERLSGRESTRWLQAASDYSLLLSRSGAADDALSMARAALVAGSVAESPIIRMQLDWAMALALDADGHRDAAIVFGKSTINRIQTLRRPIAAAPEAPFSSSQYAATHDDKFRMLIEWLTAAGRLHEAMLVRDMLAEQQAFEYSSRDPAADPRTTTISLDQEEAGWLARVTAALKQRGDRARISREIAGLLKKRKRRVEASRGPPQLQTVAADAAVVTYTLPPVDAPSSAQHLSIWIETPGQAPELVVAPVDQAQLWTVTRELYRLSAAPGSDVLPVAKQLHQLIFARADAVLRQRGKRQAVLNLDGGLEYIPFGALHDGQGWLQDRYVFVRSRRGGQSKARPAYGLEEPAAGVFGLTRALGTNPALPAVARETAFVAALAPPAKPHLDSEFTSRTLGLEIARPLDWLHIATHGEARVTEVDSYLLLGDGDRLTGRDIRQWRLQGAPLVVLSACNTAMPLSYASVSRQRLGSLAELVRQTGAGAVLAHLWKVSDTSSADLMEAFYGNLVAQGLSPARALQSAVELLRQARPEYAHPYYWASAVVFADAP